MPDFGLWFKIRVYSLAPTWTRMFRNFAPGWRMTLIGDYQYLDAFGLGAACATFVERAPC
jgi:hypothetical protein